MSGSVPTIVFTPMGDSLFNIRDPKPDSIKTVKLTVANIREVSAYIGKALGAEVETSDTTIALGPRSPVDQRLAGPWFTVGDYIIEGYDYRESKVEFRVANLTEHEKYDLR